MDGSQSGNIVNGKAVIYGVNGELNTSHFTNRKCKCISNRHLKLNLLDGSQSGNVVNNKAVIYGTNGEINAIKLQIAGSDITSTAAELNILDGVTATKMR